MGSLATAIKTMEEITVPDKCGYEDIQLLSKDPMTVFKEWFDRAKRHPETNRMPEAMTLSTVRKDGGPSSRTVLLRGLDNEGFKMYWDKRSRKSEELDVDARAALVLCWYFGASELRQVRIEGIAEQLSEEDNIEYFSGEPASAKIRATVCHQSRVVTDGRVSMIKEINRLWKAVNKEGLELQKPSYWGGYRLKPEVIEFYQGNRDTINDRIRFRKISETTMSTDIDLPPGVNLGENGWVYERLEP